MNDNMQGWAGFPAGAVPTTRVPNTLFTDLLPIIDNLAELKVTLHLLWLISRKRGPLRYARLNELLADRLFLKGLETPMLDGASALRDGLERATARGTLLHATVHRGDVAEEWYMVNSQNGRDVLAKLRSGELDLSADVAEDVQLHVERPNIFVLYEQNIGILTPMMADELRAAETEYPGDWVAEAFRTAVANNKRNWRYIKKILERWQREGKDAGRAAAEIPSDAEARKRYYLPEGYEDLINP